MYDPSPKNSKPELDVVNEKKEDIMKKLKLNMGGKKKVKSQKIPKFVETLSVKMQGEYAKHRTRVERGLVS